MARCTECNQVFSDSYLKDGVCEDCIEKDKLIKSTLTVFEKDEMIELNNKFNNIDVYKFIELKNRIESLKNKYSVEISKNEYLTLEKLLIPYFEVLEKKKNELVTLNDYGSKEYENWHNEINYFIENTFSKLLEENDLNIDLGFIHNYIFEKVNIKDTIYTGLRKAVNVDKSSIDNGKKVDYTGIIALILIVGTILFIKFLPSTPQTYSNQIGNQYNKNDEYLEQRYQKEEQERKKDIQKMLDEAKYLQLKQNHR